MSQQIIEFSPEFFDDAFFDDASSAWRNNKQQKSNNTFDYKCCWINNDGKRCTKITMINKKTNSKVFCRKHLNNVYCEEIHKWT